MWTDPGWFIPQLEVRICFWSSAAWPPTSSTWAFPLGLYFGSLWRTDTIVFAKLNKHPSQICPVSNKPPSNVFEINKLPGGLIEDWRCTPGFWDNYIALAPTPEFERNFAVYRWILIVSNKFFTQKSRILYSLTDQMIANYKHRTFFLSFISVLMNIYSLMSYPNRRCTERQKFFTYVIDYGKWLTYFSFTCMHRARN